MAYIQTMRYAALKILLSLGLAASIAVAAQAGPMTSGDPLSPVLVEMP